MLTQQQIQAFPKVELHCHLDGSIRPETLIAIANHQELSIEQDIEAVKAQMQAPKDCHDLRDYLRCFDFVRPYLQTQEALAAAAYDVMEQAAQDGVAYIEIRFAPSLSMDKGLTCSQTIRRDRRHRTSRRTLPNQRQCFGHWDASRRPTSYYGNF